MLKAFLNSLGKELGSVQSKPRHHNRNELKAPFLKMAERMGSVVMAAFLATFEGVRECPD